MSLGSVKDIPKIFQTKQNQKESQKQRLYSYYQTPAVCLLCNRRKVGQSLHRRAEAHLDVHDWQHPAQRQHTPGLQISRPVCTHLVLNTAHQQLLKYQSSSFCFLVRSKIDRNNIHMSALPSILPLCFFVLMLTEVERRDPLFSDCESHDSYT